MPRPFAQTFNWLYSRLPFSDTARTILRVWAEAIRRELLDLQTECDEVYDAAFLTEGDTTDLDSWGDVLGLTRCPTEPDDNWGVDCPGAPVDYILVAYAASMDFINQITVDMRFWLDAIVANSVLCSRANLQQEITVTPAGAIQWDVMPGTVAASAPGTIVPGTEYHVRAMYDSVGGAELWVGQPGGVFTQVAVAAGAGPMVPGAWPLTIGENWAIALPIDGVVDEIRFEDDFITTLPTDEVPRCLVETANTRIMLHCDEGAGPTAFDTSGNNNDGALMGAANWFDMTGTDWPGFRTRLLDLWRTTFDALTVTAVTDAVDALGATYVPVLAVDTVAEHYDDRLEDGTGAANDYDLGDRWGLSRLDLLTFAVEIDRIPTAAEAEELIEAIGLVRPAQTRGFLVRALPAPAGTPPRYRLYGTSYSDVISQWLWDDNFNPPTAGLADPSGEYQLINDGGAGTSWEYLVLAGPIYVLYGDASDGAAGVPHLCLPRQDLDPVILDYRDMYVDCSLRFPALTTAEHAGIVLRYDNVAGVFYAIAFHWTGATWQYQFMRWTGAAWVVIQAWTNTAADLSVYTRVQTWLEDNLWTLIINGVVEENKTDIGTDITTDGEWGFYTFGVGAFDVWVDWWRMW